MSKQTSSNPYVDSWEKELANKNFEDLVRIVALKEQYNEEFVRMAQSKLLASKDYDEDRVKAMIEEIRKVPQPKLNVPADTMLKVGNVGCITMKVLFGIMSIPLAFIMMQSDLTADNKAGAFIMYGSLWGVYKFSKKLWKSHQHEKKPA